MFGKAVSAGLTAGLVAVLALVAYGYLVDMAPAPTPQSQSVVLNGQ